MKLMNSQSQSNRRASMALMPIRGVLLGVLPRQPWRCGLWMSCCMMAIMLVGGCATEIVPYGEEEVTVELISSSELNAVANMRSDLSDAAKRVDEYCGEGTEAAAAAQNAHHDLFVKLDDYKKTAEKVNIARHSRISAATFVNTKAEIVQQHESSLASYNATIAIHDERQEIADLKTQWKPPESVGPQLASEAHTAMASAVAGLETLRKTPGVTAEQIAEAEQIINELRQLDASIDEIKRQFVQAHLDDDQSKMQEKYHLLMATGARISAGSTKISLMKAKLDLAARRESLAQADNELQAIRDEYAQKKEAMSTSMSAAQVALEAARAKAIECAGSDVLTDGTPIFPKLPGDWNSTFWDISSP